ncbi:hypothetical protein BV25DRAFT_1831421 [Artomyces pyxidatus]|uniref:Uncharacterized protein n=1 Tax=Artomyces pyxidatus TaxID=48021 RepID=A0ACB8SM45_9AGAM|nr:hypothetical protein BV25DRAFT_1831421 [Artomyces pyxidatus]
MTSESFPCQCIVPCAPYSSTSTIDTLTANSFIGGLLNFCLVMVIASGKGIIIGYSIGTVLGYLLLIILDTLYEFNEKNGPSIREWWALVCGLLGAGPWLVRCAKFAGLRMLRELVELRGCQVRKAQRKIFCGGAHQFGFEPDIGVAEQGVFRC